MKERSILFSAPMVNAILAGALALCEQLRAERDAREPARTPYADPMDE